MGCRQVVWVAACNQAECRVLDRANATTTLREDSKVEACRYCTKPDLLQFSGMLVDLKYNHTIHPNHKHHSSGIC